ncbi:alpha-2,8-sialyltransferase 8E-like [Siphateles boraxobius]|uniref:alpha-2,8-sialyltransferase 8E-like n=1 Tax=Siphateles boraxobius TaxID=180520 RepID=UPI0040641FF8
MTSFSEKVSELLTCPYKSNITQKELNRVLLRFYCNASGHLYLTKQNTAVHQIIPYESDVYPNYTMNEALHNMLPEAFPWRERCLGRCAVVGSGGILKNSNCGREIDSADYVIRFNLAPVNDSDVGLKTDLITVNPSQIRRGYRNAQKQPGPLKRRVSVYGDASLIMPAFASPLNTRLSVSTLKALWPPNPEMRVVFFSTSYLKKLDRLWKGRGLIGRRLSTGFMLINVALELCDHVDVYGFWPFDINLEKQIVPHHYFDNIGPKIGIHSMPEEFLRLLQLHSQGVLTLHLRPCS